MRTPHLPVVALFCLALGCSIPKNEPAPFRASVGEVQIEQTDQTLTVKRHNEICDDVEITTRNQGVGAEKQTVLGAVGKFLVALLFILL